MQQAGHEDTVGTDHAAAGSIETIASGVHTIASLNKPLGLPYTHSSPTPAIAHIL